MPHPDPANEGDFAQEHETAGFKASIPLAPGATEAAGPLEGFDPDHSRDRYPRPWESFKQAARSVPSIVWPSTP